MRFLNLHIDGFGKFHDLTVDFKEGLNIVYGKNEAGKSTLHTFIRCMLFGMERGRGRAARNDLYSRYEPWQNKAAFGGWLRLEKDGVTYRIERNFQKDQKAFTVVDETAGREIEPTKSFMDFLLCGLTETTYNNTISIGQLKSATDGGMVSELRNYIANMNTSGSMALNITKASAYLKNRRREFERQLSPDAGKNYTSLLGEIRNMEREISSPEYENQLQACQDQKSQVKNQLGEKLKEREELLLKIAKGRQALDSAQFTDEASVTAYRDEARASYREYLAAKKASGKKGRILLAVLAFLLSASSLLGIGLPGRAAALADNLLGGMALDHSRFLLICAGMAAVFFTIGAALLFHHRALKKEAAVIGKLLQETFSRHLGDPSLTEEAMNAFEARMEEFIRLSQILERSQASVAKQDEEISDLRRQETSCEESISRQQRNQWELEKKLDHLTRCKDQVESLRRILEENERIREEISAIDLALDTMTELSSTIRDSFGLYLNQAASDLVASITGGIYDSMSVDENLNLFLNTQTRLVPVDQVSSGTMDQVYLALRLAAARLIMGGSGQMPLVFDDSFVLYDDDRLRTALGWLARTWPGQIMIFTCHQREAQMLTACGQEYALIKI
ncbi:MAG: AAA family ATPase [Eubacteriales bacterium]|nr:AAA family ATPase [Eubacteriales bacterium]